MAGKTPAERRALAGLASRILSLFEEAGYAHIDPDILQPADLFLDRSGEDIRARTFVFADPSGAELCLRPDLTVPACRYHLSHAARPDEEARYCYGGPAFRFQPGGAARQPAEFHQSGIEWYAAPDAEAAEAEVLALAIRAVEAAGLRGHRVRLGDLGLFHALLEATPMPQRWRRRLAHQFWRPRAFRALVEALTGARARPRTSISPLIDELEQVGVGQAEALVARTLDARGLPLIGGRSLEDIAGRLAEKAADRIETPLAPLHADWIDDYLALRGAPADVAVKLTELAGRVGGAMKPAAERFARRNALIAQRGIDQARLDFAAAFGRSLEYYTGFVFQIEIDGPHGAPLTIAGGGRYDGMMSDIGSPVPVPAVGCALYTERLLAAGGGA